MCYGWIRNRFIKNGTLVFLMLNNRDNNNSSSQLFPKKFNYMGKYFFIFFFSSQMEVSVRKVKVTRPRRTATAATDPVNYPEISAGFSIHTYV